MEKDKKQLAPLRIVAAAYIILALALIGVQFARVLKNSNRIEFTSMGVSLAAWVVVAICLFFLARRGREYLKGFLGAGVGVVATALEIYMARRNLAAGMGSIYSYVDFYVIAFWFLAVVALLYSFAKILNGLAKDVAPYNQDMAYTYAGKWWLVGTIVLLMLFLIPVAGFFPKVPQLIATAIFGLIALGAQLYVCKLILDGYNTIAKAKLSKNRALGMAGHERTMMLTTEDLKKVQERLAAQEAVAPSEQKSSTGANTHATGTKNTAATVMASTSAGSIANDANEGGWAKFKRGMADKIAQKKEQWAQRADRSEKDAVKKSETKQEAKSKATETRLMAQQKATESQKAAEEAARLSGASRGAAANTASIKTKREERFHGGAVESYDWKDPSKLAEEKVGVAPKITKEVPKIDADRFKREIHAFRHEDPQNQRGQALHKESHAQQEAPQRQEQSNENRADGIRQRADTGVPPRSQNHRGKHSIQKRQEPRRVSKVVKVPQQAERPQEKDPSKQ